MSSNLEQIITGDVYTNILDYLDICSIKNLLMTCKMIYYNKQNRLISKKVIHKRIYNIFYSIFRKYIFYTRIINHSKTDIRYSSNILAIHYYQNYPKDVINKMYMYIKSYFDALITNYRPNFIVKNYYSRYDLYKLISQMTIDDINTCGW